MVLYIRFGFIVSSCHSDFVVISIGPRRLQFLTATCCMVIFMGPLWLGRVVFLDHRAWFLNSRSLASGHWGVASEISDQEESSGPVESSVDGVHMSPTLEFLNELKILNGTARSYSPPPLVSDPSLFISVESVSEHLRSVASRPISQIDHKLRVNIDGISAVGGGHIIQKSIVVRTTKAQRSMGMMHAHADVWYTISHD